jgi:hypothetical protein
LKVPTFHVPLPDLPNRRSSLSTPPTGPPGLQFNQVLSIKPKCRVCRHPEDRVPRIQVLSQDKEQGGLRRCHVSHVSGLCLTERRAPALPHVPQLRTSPPRRGGLRCCHVDPTSPPREESSGAATYPTATSGLWTTGIKKGLTAPGTQLGSHVSKARSRVTEAPARRADRPLQFGSTVQRRPS